MGRSLILNLLAIVLITTVVALPRSDFRTFLRSAVETVPQHEPLAAPIRSSVESVPLRSLRFDDDERLPLRDAVEKRPIATFDPEMSYKFLDVEDAEEFPDIQNLGALRVYYGAASYLNNITKNDERLEQGNANLQEMQQTASEPEVRRLVVCYMESWAAYRSPPLAFTAGLVPKSCTNLHYAFATLHPHTYAIIPRNEDYDVIKGGYRIATGLKQKYPGLKVMISVGGDGSERLFSEMVQEQNRRSSFIDSAVNFLRGHDFDGLDLHWVYPGENDEREKELLTNLLYELREKFSSYGLLLSTILPPFRYQIEDGYVLSAVSGATDYVTLQAWDMMHGKRDEAPPRAVQHSTLHRDPGASSRDQRYDNIEFMVKYIIRNGMAADKLVLGVPLFGRSYTLTSAAQAYPGSLVSGWGDEGQYTQTKGLLAYFEICMAEREGKLTSGVDEAGNSYAVFDNQWVTYDTRSNILEKMKFVVNAGLAGAAAWAVDMDDFRGLCGQPFPLLSAISTSLNGESLQTDQSSLKIGTCDPTSSYLASDEGSCAHFQFCSGGVNYRLRCEDDKLYDPSTGFCGHQDVAKCVPGQNLRITVEDATRQLAQSYDDDFEWGDYPMKDLIKKTNDNERIVASSITAGKKEKSSDKRVVCYMTSWAFYRRGDGKFVPEHIDTRLCTHVVYAYASLSPDDLVAKEFDPWADITNNLYERVTSLRDVKVMLGLGGWTDSAGDKYSRLVSSAAARAKFSEKVVAFLRMHNFQGLHLDWNYPVCWQSNCKKGAKSDKANFAKLLQVLSSALHAADMELGVALSGYKEVIESAYDLPAISKAADFMSTMTYDYHGGWERTTAHHTPLVPVTKDALAYYSIEYAIKALISGGADPKKLLLGLSFYGQSYRLADVEGSSGPGAPAAGPGEPGEFTKQPGMLAYYEICYRVKNLRWKTGRIDKAGPYAYSDNQWVGYDDPKSITEKVQWALRQGLGGVTAWAIDLDDFNNRCCAEPSPLLRAAGRALGHSIPAPTSACERPPAPVTPAPPTTTPAESDGSMGSGSHNHGSHEHTSTTWPSWSPSTTTTSTTTTQSWWVPATTTTSTTTKPPTTAAPTKPPVTDNLEDSTCVAGEYRAAPGDCESYLQCEAGRWRKNRCAPGLHWSAKAMRCDWPSFAKCSEKPPNAASTATTTLAPMTSRPPTTTRPTTTTARPTTTTITTAKPTTTRATTTTTTTTTAKPTTSAPHTPGAISEGDSCIGESYQPVAGDCGSYLHCDGSSWRRQRCAPGLHWSQKDKHCDWPKYAKCEDSEPSKPTQTTARPTRPPKPSTKPPTTATSEVSNDSLEGETCGTNDLHASSTSCDSYLLCVSGKWRKQLCPPGLHWDKRTKRCDWVEFAMCEGKPQATKSPMAASTTPKPMYTTKRMTTTTKKPIIEVDNVDKPEKPCQTGSYYAHPKCEKFFVCVNGMMIAQSCAPGLVWNADRSQCDFPSATSCTDRRQVAAMVDATKPGSMELSDEIPIYCENGQYTSLPSDCTRYRHCIFGKFEEFSCATGLHWNQDKQICDWPKQAKCKVKATTTTSKPLKEPMKPSKPEEDKRKPSKPATVMPTPTPGALEPKPSPSVLNSRYKVVCYYTNWSWYRPGIGSYVPESIDPSLCTHVIYAFAVLGHDGLITAHDTWADYDNRFYERVVEFKRRGLKVLLGLGGWNDSAGDKYSKLVNNPSARARFVTHAVQFLDKYNFDGLDLDWEYPKCWQVDCSKGPASDKEAFADLVRELSAEFKPRGLLLSAAVSPSKKVIDEGYDVPVLARHLDWIAVMTYDYHGQWDKKTGHVAPLYYHPDDDYTYFNANFTIHYWMRKGAPASKIVMGMPLYGQTFTLESQKNNPGLNVPAVSGGEAGEYTRAKGFLAYYEICDRIQNQNWKVIQDPYKRMGPYAYKGNQWVSFDDRETIKRKVNFIKSLNLAGGMVWALDLDDFRNRCGQGKHPLMNEIKNGFLNPHIDSETLQIAQATEKPSMTQVVDDDLDDIEVKPGYMKPTTSPRPMKVTMKPQKPTSVAHPIKEERYKVVCYYTNWSWYRPGSGKYTPSDIDPALCTHIVYAFAVLDSNKLVIKPHDTDLDIDNKFFEKVLAMKKRGLRVVLGLGGWNDSAGNKYSRLVNNVSARRKFVVHAIDFLEQFGFDGLDLDWEYPKCWQANCEKGPSSDKQGFAELVKDLREAFTPRGLLLSAAVSASKRVIDAGYDVPTLSKNLDWISLMTYDYHGQWDKKTGHVAPMYARDDDADHTLNTNFTVYYWINKGASPEKLILGVPFYGQSFTLMENAAAVLGSPTSAGGEAGDETRARGFLSYYEICDRIRSQGWRVTRDPAGRIGPFASYGDQWVSFDDDFMIRHKSGYVRAMGLGGSMVWALDLDDFTGEHCGCGKSPLLRNINHVLRNKPAPEPCSLMEIQGASSTEMMSTDMETTSENDLSPPEPEQTHISSSSMEGKSCRDTTFKADDFDCRKYYLCINGQYIELTCPESLFWNKNHCDWPEKSSCKAKANLRLTEEGYEVKSEHKPILACYFTNWAYYRQGSGSFGPEQVDPSLCTHIIYAWAHLDENTYKLVPGNNELDIVNDFYGKITEFRSQGIKVILGVGGLEDSEDDKWSQMASDDEKRRTFVNSVIKMLEKWHFDGLQLAWQYPVCKQAPCTDVTRYELDKNGFSTLVLDLSVALRTHALEYSVLVSASPEVSSVAYDNNVLREAVDWIAIAANDYYASTTGKTAYLLQIESTDNSRTSVKQTLEYWLDVMPAHQLVVGVPGYGRSYTLRRASHAADGTAVTGPGVPGDYTGVPGFLAYYEICSGLKTKDWQETETVDGTYAVRGSQWAAYLRPEEVHRIASSVALAGVRGAALWALDLDDWRANCSCKQPLLNALRQGFFEPKLPFTPCL